MSQPIYVIESTTHAYAGSQTYTSETTVETSYGWFADDAGAREVIFGLEAEAREAHELYNAETAVVRNKLIASSERLNAVLREAHDTEDAPQVLVPAPVEPISFRQFCKDFGYPTFRDVSLAASGV